MHSQGSVSLADGRQVLLHLLVGQHPEASVIAGAHHAHLDLVRFEVLAQHTL